MPLSILLLEDDSVIGEALKFALEQQGYFVAWGKDISTAKRLVEEKLPDVYLLDWNLPDGTGFDWALQIREYDEEVPILFLTARNDEESAVQALKAGANDFIRKPFGNAELLARIKKATKEVMQAEDYLRYGDLLIDKKQRIAFASKKPLRLSPREYAILELLVKRAPNIVSREELLNLAKDSSESVDRAIDPHISRIRKKIRESNLKNVVIHASPGIGYKLEKGE